MFGFGKIFEKGKPFIHIDIDGKLDIDVENPHVNEGYRDGGTCSECIWMTGMSDEAITKCNTCKDHKNFYNGKKSKESEPKRKRRRER